MSTVNRETVTDRQVRVRPSFQLMLLLIGFLITENARAECVSPLITPTECDFKNEDTHLWGYQPGMYFAKEDRVDELIEQGETFIENYYSGVKTKGDLAIRAMIAPTAAAMATVEAVEAGEIAVILANDPLRLKDIYTDIYCEIYWETVSVVSNIDRDCPTTPKLLTDITKLQELDRVRQEITDTILNPNLVLGEQWPDVTAEIERIRAELSSLGTFGRNIPTIDIDQMFDNFYPSLAALLGRTTETKEEFHNRIARLTDSRRNTIRDHLVATNTNWNNLLENDKPELARLHEMSKRAVGRMQAFEIENMIGLQNVQNWLSVSEETMNQGGMYIQDYADKHALATRQRAFAIRAAEPTPFYEAIVGGGEAFRQ